MCRLFHQHQPTFGAFLRCFPSRPVPLEIHRAGVRESKAAAFVGFFFGRREAMVMKQVFRDSTDGDCSTQWMPSARVIGSRPRSASSASASAGDQLRMSSPREGSASA